MERAVRWAIIGTGEVSRQFVAGLRVVADAQPALVVSRNPATAQRFATSNGVTRAVGATTAAELTAALGDEVDVVYVATPPSEHMRHALAAIGAGKPVLVEKPFAVDAESAARVVDAARTAGVFCMEAMWTRFLPLVVEARRLVQAGALGEPRSMTAAFLGADVPDPGQGNFDPSRGGGALMHRGVYGVSLARHLLGPVAATSATARIGTTGVDEDTAVVLRHEAGPISTITSSLRTAGPNGFTIYGTEGRLDVSGPIYRPSFARLTPIVARRRSGRDGGPSSRLAALRQSAVAHAVRQRAGTLVEALRPPRPRIVRRPYRGNGYQYQVEAVHAALAAGVSESSVMPLDESIETMQILDSARRGWHDHEGTTG